MIDKIKIGWKTYDIEQTEDKSILTVANGECYGEIDYDNQKIYLNNKYSEEQRKSTLIHEVLHAIENMYNIEVGERNVTVLGDALYTVLKDNGLKIVKE